jgi:hypothetical protein
LSFRVFHDPFQIVPSKVDSALGTDFFLYYEAVVASSAGR